MAGDFCPAGLELFSAGATIAGATTGATDSVTAGFGLSSPESVRSAPGSLRPPPSGDEKGIASWSLEPSVPISADIDAIVPASGDPDAVDPGSAGRISPWTISIARLRRASHSSKSLSGGEGFACAAAATGPDGRSGATPDITLLGRSAD